MPNGSDESLSKKINIWVQTLGIVVAALWGVYTFVYKEILVPKTAPINITVDLELRQVETRAVQTRKAGNLVPVEMTVSAKNPSTREIQLLPSAFVAYGYKVTRRDDTQAIPEVIVSSSSEMSYLDVHAKTESHSLVAFGRLFSDVALMPSEVLTRKLVFYVPENTYNFISVHSTVPSVTTKGTVDLEWKLNREKPEPIPVFYKVAGTKREVIGNDQERQRMISETEMQVSGSMSQLALTR